MHYPPREEPIFSRHGAIGLACIGILFVGILVTLIATTRTPQPGLDFQGLAQSMPPKYRSLFAETKMCLAFAENAEMIAERRDAGQMRAMQGPNDMGDSYAATAIRMVVDHVYATKASPPALFADVLASCEKAF